MTFDEFLAGRLADLVRFAVVLCGRRATAEQLVTDAILHVYPRRVRVDDPSTAFVELQVWVVRGYLSEGMRLGAGPATDVDRPIVDASEADDDWDDLTGRFVTSSKLQRTLAALRYYAGMDVAATASVMGSTPEGIALYLQRVLQDLNVRADDGTGVDAPDANTEADVRELLEMYGDDVDPDVDALAARLRRRLPDGEAEERAREAEQRKAECVEAERLEAERAEAERAAAARLEAERLETERVEAQKLEAERVEAERAEAARLEAQRVEAERVEAERAEVERVETERLEAERAEAERLEAERVKAERLEADRVEAERLEAERVEAERVEAERVEAERLDAERLEEERLEAERGEAERLEAERVEAEGVEAEGVEAERVQAERLEEERLEEERLEAERAEAERVAAERIEAERAEAERAEAEHVETERVDAGLADAERVEAERLEAERVAAERAEFERLEAERAETERVEAARLAAEQLAAERAEIDRLEAELVASELVAAQLAAAEQAEADAATGGADHAVGADDDLDPDADVSSVGDAGENVDDAPTTEPPPSEMPSAAPDETAPAAYLPDHYTADDDPADDEPTDDDPTDDDPADPASPSFTDRDLDLVPLTSLLGPSAGSAPEQADADRSADTAPPADDETAATPPAGRRGGAPSKPARKPGTQRSAGGTTARKPFGKPGRKPTTRATAADADADAAGQQPATLGRAPGSVGLKATPAKAATPSAASTPTAPPARRRRRLVLVLVAVVVVVALVVVGVILANRHGGSKSKAGPSSPAGPGPSKGLSSPVVAPLPGTKTLGQFSGIGSLNVDTGTRRVAADRTLVISVICQGTGPVVVGPVALSTCKAPVNVAADNGMLTSLTVTAPQDTKWRIALTDQPDPATNGSLASPPDSVLDTPSAPNVVGVGVSTGRATIRLKRLGTTRVRDLRIALTCTGSGSGVTITSANRLLNGKYTRTCFKGWSYEFDVSKVALPSAIVVTASGTTAWRMVVIAL